MYIKPQPIGVTPPSSEDALPVWRAISGDKLTLQSPITLMDGTTPVTPANSLLTFVLAENRFDQISIWEGTWGNGIKEVDPINHPGLIEVYIPPDIGNRLRRGTYNFSLTVTTRLAQNPYVTLVGTLLVEYEPSSPEHNIPYKHQESDYYNYENYR